MSATCVSDHELWHKRLDHLSRKGMKTLKNIVSGINPFASKRGIFREPKKKSTIFAM